VAGHSRYELFAMTGIIDIGRHQKGARSTLYKIRECDFEVGFRAGVCYHNALSGAKATEVFKDELVRWTPILKSGGVKME